MSLSADQLKGWIAQQTGLDVELLDREWFDSLMAERLQARGLPPSVASYRDLLERYPDELQKVVSEVAVPETCFFRYPASFDCLAAYLQQLQQQPAVVPHLRMLSVACATGEEPISMAITAAHAGWPLDRIQVDAVDREPRHLDHARQNRFPRFSVREDLPTWSKRWIHPEGDEFVADPTITSCIQWKQADVTAASNPFALRYHVVFCRNLLVYLNVPARQQLTHRLAEALQTGGLLFVGHADAFELLRDRFEPQSNAGAFAFRSKALPAARQLRNDPPSRLPRTPRFRLMNASPPPTSTATTDPPQEPPPTRSLQDAIEMADGGQLAEALRICESLQPSVSPKLFALMGSILTAMNRCSEARVALRKSIYLDPASADTLLQLAIVEERLGEPAQAERYRQRAAEIHEQETDQ